MNGTGRILPTIAIRRARSSGTPRPTPIGMAPRSSMIGIIETKKVIIQLKTMFMVIILAYYLVVRYEELKNLFYSWFWSSSVNTVGGFAFHHSFNLSFGKFDCRLIWEHYRESLAWVAVGEGATSGTV